MVAHTRNYIPPLATLCAVFSFNRGLAFPNACTVISAPSFDRCTDLSITPDMCGTPPYQHPCAHVSYYVPSTFVEVVSNGTESFFTSIPSAALQLGTHGDFVPFGAENYSGAYSYQAHAITVPFVSIPYAAMTCGSDMPVDRFCFGAMSEHVGMHWRTGSGDTLQPKFMAWSMSPQACILAGQIPSNGTFNATGVDAKLCSYNHDWLAKFPPSSAAVCTGWGIHFPRSGTVTSSDQTTASLVIASRIKTLGSEVFQSVQSSSNEKWSMIYPNKTSCFREGENIASLMLKNVNDSGRLLGKFKNYLYVSWQQVSCKKEWYSVPVVQTGLQIAKSVCQGLQ